MQDNDSNRENQFRDAGADPSEVIPGQTHNRGRGRGRARVSRNWREDPGPQDGGYNRFRGRGRGRGGFGENREYESRKPNEDGDEPPEENNGNETRFRDPYFDSGSFRPFRGRRGGGQDGGFQRGRGRGRGRGGNFQEQDVEQAAPTEGEVQEQSNTEWQEEERAPRNEGGDRRYDRGGRGGYSRGYRNEGRWRGNDQRREYGSRGNDAENGNGYDQQDDQQNTDERGYYPRRGNGASPTQKWKWNNNNTNGSYNDNQHDEAPVAEERECGEDRPTQFQRSSPPAPSGKPQRRQRAPHLRSNCRNEDEVLALFECHHQQKGISLDNYGNIPVEMVPRDIEPVELFSELHVCPSLAENIERCGYKSPTPVQRYGIPVALQGNDLMACAQTGSGKTAAFLIPIANYILINGVSPAKKGVSFPIGLVLAPTRELALQIFDEVRKITFRTDIFGDVVYGGTAYPSRFENDILVACPGRLSDMFDRGLVSFSEIKFLVLDEADRMLEMGFEEQIEHLVSSRYSDMPKSDDRQTLMFSATFPQRILNLAKRYLRKQYYLLTVGRVGSTTKNITQIIERVDNDEKIDRLFKIIYEHKKTDLVLVFVETKKAAEDLHRELNRQNIPSATIHGDRRQQDRESALASFKSGETPILVATDVASRGLDIPDVSHIIQFDLPAEMDDYTHRIGRTGRAGNKGTATCFYTKNNRKICLELFKYFSEHDQHVPSWFKQEAEQIEGEAMLSRNTIGGGRGGNRRRTAEENQGTWGDTCEPRAPRGNQGPKKRQMFPDDGGF